jgi:hypothetical protein
MKKAAKVLRQHGQGVERITLNSGKTVEAFGMMINRDTKPHSFFHKCYIDGDYKWIAEKNIKHIEKIRYGE